MIESLRTTQIAFFRFATPYGFFRGIGDEVQKISVQGSVQEKIIWKHLWEHRFSVPDPRVFPPPDGRFSPQTTENPNLWLGHTGSPVMISKLHTIISNKLWDLSLYFGHRYNRWVLASQQKALGPCKCARFRAKQTYRNYSFLLFVDVCRRLRVLLTKKAFS